MSDLDVLTVPEVATKLRKTERFVRDELGRGRLRGSRFGGAWHVRPADLAAYIEANMNIRAVEKRVRKSA